MHTHLIAQSQVINAIHPRLSVAVFFLYPFPHTRALRYPFVIKVNDGAYKCVCKGQGALTCKSQTVHHGTHGHSWRKGGCKYSDHSSSRRVAKYYFEQIKHANTLVRVELNIHRVNVRIEGLFVATVEHKWSRSRFLYIMSFLCLFHI